MFLFNFAILVFKLVEAFLSKDFLRCLMLYEFYKKNILLQLSNIGPSDYHLFRFLEHFLKNKSPNKYGPC